TDLVAATIVGPHIDLPLSQGACGRFERSQPLARGTEDHERDRHRSDSEKRQARPRQRRAKLAKGHLQWRWAGRHGDVADLRAVHDDGGDVRGPGWGTAAAPSSSKLGRRLSARLGRSLSAFAWRRLIPLGAGRRLEVGPIGIRWKTGPGP